MTKSAILVKMRGMRLHPPIPGTEPNAPALAVVVVFAILGTLQTSCTSCRIAPRPSSTLQLAETPRRAEMLPSSPLGAPLVCPTFGPSGMPAALQSKGGHKVILSWKASAPANSKHAAAVGYCIYRGIKHKDPSPELVNSIPFSGTSCADDLVENGKKYYYVVRAISANRVTSIVSNEAPAGIPIQSNPSVSRASVPLCWEPTAVK